MFVKGKQYRTVWMDGTSVFMINQPLIPHTFEIIELRDHRETAKSISTMIVRGAGAIGATAGYGMAQVFLEAPESSYQEYVEAGAATLKSTRPTAQDLFYAVERVKYAAEKENSIKNAQKAAVAEAQSLADKNSAACEQIGIYGEPLIKEGARIETHCNAGWLAFVDWGSALSPIYKAKRNGKNLFVYADVTGPRNQGSRLTAWELMNEGVDCAIVADNAGAYIMSQGKVDMIIVGSDRIAANGDVANKIGTFEKAIVAQKFGIPFYVAAPTSTIDLNSASGKDIPIEIRSDDEVLNSCGWVDGKFQPARISPAGAKAFNVAFDVTPAEYVEGIITEKGIVKPGRDAIAKLFA